MTEHNEFLTWICARLLNKYEENPNYDYMLLFNKFIEQHNKIIKTLRIIKVGQYTTVPFAMKLARELLEEMGIDDPPVDETKEPPTAIKYNELIMAVCNKHKNETRHQTALRYIREAEMGIDDPPKVKVDDQRTCETCLYTPGEYRDCKCCIGNDMLGWTPRT